MASISKTPAVLSSEILIKSLGYNGWFILLEGDFDQRFWESRLNPVQLRPINCVGKPNVLGTLDLLTSTNQAQKVVALADKDYDEILARLRKFPQLIYTDDNDLEVTLLCAPHSAVEPTMQRILRESIDTEKLRSFEARAGHSVVEHLRRIVANYGALRLLNEKLQSGVNFEGLPIRHNSFLDHTTLQQNQMALQSAFVEAANQAGKVQITAVNLAREIELYQTNGVFSGWSLVQGHDLMQLLAIAINSTELRNEAGHRQVSEESLARDLCLMMHKNDLQTTAMFRGIDVQGNLAGVAFFK